MRSKLLKRGQVGLLAAVAALASGAFSFAQQPESESVVEVRSIALEHRTAGELADQVRTMLGGLGGTQVFVDQRANELVVRGAADDLAFAASVIAKLDQPVRRTAAPSRLEAYSVPSNQRGPIEQWARRLSQAGGGRAAWDPRTGQLLVFGAEDLHRQIAGQLTERGQQAIPVAGRGEPAAPTRPSRVQRSFKLSTLSAEALHTRLEKLTGRRLPIERAADGRSQSFPVQLGDGFGVRARVDDTTKTVELTGPAEEVPAWRDVIAALDTAPAAKNESTGVVASPNARGPGLRRALGAIEARGGKADARLVTMLLQKDGPQDESSLDAGQEEPAQPSGDAQPAPADALGGGALLGPVQIEFIDGLDIIVVRGNEDDVQRVMQIINQIETLSEVTVPEIQVYPLRHVDSISMGRLLRQVYQDVLGPRTGSVSITPLGKPDALLLIGRKENVDTAANLVKQLDQPVSPTARLKAFQLQHGNAAEAEELITRYFEAGEDDQEDRAESVGALAGRPLVVADSRSNTLIVRAAPRDMLEIAELVKRIDRPADAQAELKVFAIKNGDAQALAEMLISLFGSDDDDEQGGLGAGGSSLAPLQITFDQRTNSIVAAGGAEDLEIVEAVLLRLDQDGLRQRETRVFRLNNAFSPEVADALNQLLEDQREAEDAAELTISPFEQIDREVIIVAEQATNTLIVSANPQEFAQIERLITDLDARPPMVMVQVLIAEVRLNDTDEFGLEVGLQDSLLFDRSVVGDLNTITNSVQDTGAGGAVTTVTEQEIINAPLTPGFNFNDVLNPLGNNGSTGALESAGRVAAQGLTNFAVGRASNALGFGGFVFSASSNSISLLLRALQENRRLEVLSRPQVMMLDNQPGAINVGQRVPIIQGSSINQFGQQTNQFNYEPVGISLNVTPRISPDNTVVMQIRAERSAVGDEADGIPVFITPGGDAVRVPPIDQTLAETTVSATSGQTVVLSGLLTKNTFDIHRRVPILADIPLLGDLFRFDSVQQQRTELLIIMTPRVVRSEADAEMLKQVEAARMSWVMCDVVNLHGPSGLRTRNDEWDGCECEEVYPTLVPAEGQLVPPSHSDPSPMPLQTPPLPDAAAADIPGRQVNQAAYRAAAAEFGPPRPAPSAQPRRLPAVGR